MALDKEFLTGVFEGVEGAEERIGKVLKEFESETTGLRVNKDAILKESKDYKDKLEKLAAERESEKSGLQKRIEELENQVKASGGEELKAYYEAEKKKLEEMYAAKLTEQEKAIGLHKSERENLYSEYLKVLKNTELDRAMDSHSNLIPEMKNILRDVFWARNQFELTELDGVKKLLNPKDNYRSIEDTLKAFIATEEGKSFLLNNSTGGGATGGNIPNRPAIGNPFIKGKENLDEQGRLYKENPSLYASLKAQAEALAEGG
jgi:hypothetical protein